MRLPRRRTVLRRDRELRINIAAIAVVVVLSLFFLKKAPKSVVFHPYLSKEPLLGRIIDQKQMKYEILDDLKSSFDLYSRLCSNSDSIMPLSGKCVNTSGQRLTAFDYLIHLSWQDWTNRSRNVDTYV